MKKIKVDSVSKSTFIEDLKRKWIEADIGKKETWKLEMRGDSYIFHDISEFHGFLIGLIFDNYFWKT